MSRHLALALLALLSLASAGAAADQTVLGTSLLVKNPGTPAQRKVVVKAKETFTDATIVGDPITYGATLTIDVDGAAPGSQTFALPAGVDLATLKPFWSGDGFGRFTYKDPKGRNGAVKSARIKRANGVFTIKATIDGKLGAVDLVPPNPGSGGCVVLGIAGGDTYSVAFTTGVVRNQFGALFQVTRPTSEGSCVPTTTTTTTSSTTTTTLPPWPDTVPPGPAPLRYRDQVFSGVTTTSNVTYGSAVNGSGQTVTLRLDVYEPTGDAVTARPAIVWVHGGSFSSGSKTSGELVDQATVFAQKGYFNVSISYRLEPGGCTGSASVETCILAMQEAMADARTAIRFLRTNAAAYRLDTDRIAIGGTSAGGVTALHVGFGRVEDPTAPVAAAVSFSGANILNVIGAGDAPSLLFHGTADVVVPYSWATSTYNQALAAGLDSFLTSWQGAGHVPYVQNRTQILTQTTNFLYWEMDLANAAQ